jgi:nitrate/TMAO reductase-like tetraheme cytochrome c subunit
MKYIVLLCVLAGCRASLPTATATDAFRANVELAELQRGRSLVVSKCGNCHRPPHPAERRPNEWPETLDEMSQRANVDLTQRHLIEEYLITMAER